MLRRILRGRPIPIKRNRNEAATIPGLIEFMQIFASSARRFSNNSMVSRLDHRSSVFLLNPAQAMLLREGRTVFLLSVSILVVGPFGEFGSIG